MSRTGLIIGAGMAGLTAAAELAGRGMDVRVIEKGREVGGRMATRRFDGAVFDHGAQFYTARSGQFQSQIANWRGEGVAETWFEGPPARFAAGDDSAADDSAGDDSASDDSGGEDDDPSAQSDSHTRFRGEPGMNALAKSLAEGLQVHVDERLTHLEFSAGTWRALSDTGTSWEADFVILTPPVPQCLSLLDAGNVPLSRAHRATLEGIEYDPCLGLMVLLEGPSALEPPGALSLEHPVLAWIGDNFHKGISPLEGSVTLHANADWSREHFHEDGDRLAGLLLDAAEPWLAQPIYRWQLHRWRYAKPRKPLGIGCLALPELSLVFAGDAFAEPKIEGAYLSGLAAAREFLKG